MGDLGRGLLLQEASRPGLDQLGPICNLLPGPQSLKCKRGMNEQVDGAV